MKARILSFLASGSIQLMALASLVMANLLAENAPPAPVYSVPLHFAAGGPKPVTAAIAPRSSGSASRAPRRAQPFRVPATVPVGISSELDFDASLRVEWADPVQPGVPEGFPSAPVAAPFDPVRVGGEVRPPRKLHHVAPLYPAAARLARIEGDVVLEALIDLQGNVVNLAVVRSVPLLDQAALEAVRQWRYEPTRLNGVAVPSCCRSR